jgi:hypothetical protein
MCIGGVEVYLHLFFDLGTRWRWVVRFTSRPLYPQGKSPWYPLDRRLGGPQSHSGCGGEEKNSQPPPAILILSPHLHLDLPSGLLPSVFDQHFVYISHLYAPPIPPFFSVQVMELLIMQTSPAFHHSLLLGPNILLSTPLPQVTEKFMKF